MRHLLVAALAVMLTLPVAAQDGQKGSEAYERGDYATALREWRPLAEQGRADAQNNLGVMYKEGQGVPQDYNAAAKWYREAAKQGLAEAQYNLGIMYAYGWGVEKNYGETVKWWHKAAGQGDALAQFNMGMMYAGLFDNPYVAFGEIRDYTELGVPPDHVEAVKWIRKAAEQGLIEAQYALAGIYGGDLIGPRDDAEAEKWNRKIAKQEGREPQFNFSLGRKYAEQDPAEAMKWYLKSAEQGYAEAQYTLGVIYHNGELVPRDEVEAYKWYEIAAAQGYQRAAVTRDVVLAEEMTSAEITKAQRLAREWLAKHSKAE